MTCSHLCPCSCVSPNTHSLHSTQHTPHSSLRYDSSTQLHKLADKSTYLRSQCCVAPGRSTRGHIGDMSSGGPRTALPGLAEPLVFCRDLSCPDSPSWERTAGRMRTTPARLLLVPPRYLITRSALLGITHPTIPASPRTSPNTTLCSMACLTMPRLLFQQRISILVVESQTCIYIL